VVYHEVDTFSQLHESNSDKTLRLDVRFIFPLPTNPVYAVE